CSASMTATMFLLTWWALNARVRRSSSPSPSISTAGRWKSAAGRSRNPSFAATITSTETREAMSYKAIYTYAWDLAEHGTGAAIDEIRGVGLDTITLAGSYHAGKFLRPRGKAGKVYFPEDGTTYFNADPSRYGAIKPAPNGLLREGDVLRELTDNGGV